MLNKPSIITLLALCFASFPMWGFNQRCHYPPYQLAAEKTKQTTRYLYGQASFYASKFEGRKTATGQILRHSKYTAACNVVPLGTWLQVTNLRNGRAVLVQVNDRLHPKSKRLVDLTKAAAQRLGFLTHGLTRVKVEILKGQPSG